MASSRASSPASNVSPSSPAQLTPRSKVQAMLATLDDDADDAATLQTNILKPQRKIGSAPSPRATAPSESHTIIRGSTDTDGNEDENETELLAKPRRGIASRMVTMESHSDLENGGETARDRVKRMLLADAKGPQEPTAESDEEDVPIKSRKRKIRQAVTTISSPVRDRPLSPGGLFVSPASNRTASPARDGSDSEDLPANPNVNSRFLALVAKKREERLAKEAEIARQKQKQTQRTSLEELSTRQMKLIEEDDIEASDEDVERQLTQQARPTRKASKKAVEEMHRETQRISRNMQLAHEARTKKKITRSSLFARFNYKPEGFAVEEPALTRPTSSSSAPHSDAETKETPPTSPVSPRDDLLKNTLSSNALNEHHADELEPAEDLREDELPSLEKVFSSQNQVCSSPPQGSRTNKGKGKAVESPNLLAKSANKAPLTRRAIRVLPPKVPANAGGRGSDSDSDLEIVRSIAPPRKSKLDSIFDSVPARQARESHSLHALRMLAHITSPGKKVAAKNVKPSMTATELQTSLQQRARQQAAREREERLEDLRSRGVIVPTAEERERDMAAVEDLIAKARKQAEDIAKEEKDAARKERQAKGEDEPLGENSSDDEEWEEDKDDLGEQLSGSEDDGDDEGILSGEEGDEESGDEEEEESDKEDRDSVDDEKTACVALNPLIDNEASESENDEDDEDTGMPTGDEDGFINDDEEDELPAAQPRRTTKHHVISDDEEEEEEEEDFASPILPHTDSPVSNHADSPIAPPSVLRSATKTFIPGLTVAGPAGLGLTQIFAGTMDESQTQRLTASPSMSRYDLAELNAEQGSLAFLRNLPAPDFPAFEATLAEDTQDIVRDSQTQIAESQDRVSQTQGIQLNFSQSQIHGFDSLVQEPIATQFSESVEATQDGGFQAMSPIKGRFAELPPSTVDTVILEQTSMLEVVHESPIAKKKGKLRRKADMDVGSEDDVSAPEIRNDFDISTNAFDVMRKAPRKEVVVDEFDKTTSGAKDMVHEQAEESEDEYAGLGGVSEDGSDDEEDALVAAMIDDEAGKDVDESKLAAFYADKERASDEKQVEKLFKDITNGFLRRKRGQDYDLSDSDDGGEARRRMKQREFAKMRKALLEDERIGKIAENPKKLAFLRAIEDRDEDEDEMDFLEDYVDSQNASDSQSQSQIENEDSRVNNSQPEPQPEAKTGPPKRKFSSDGELENRLPPHLRRTKASGRPSNLSEVRESLSSLIDEPNTTNVRHELSDSESDEGDEPGPEGKQKDKENKDPFAPRRSSSIPIVDRISLKRQASNSAISNTTRLAFTALSSNSGFKVPPLLRRATTNSSISSGSSSNSATERMAGGAVDDKSYIKRGGGKTGGVHYFARENERKMKVKEGEKRREQKRFKGAEGRRKAVGGLFGMGKFE